ncbi:EAL domain-containing protein [Thioalkalivibrio sp. ALMg11]|uniref:EAL domain-containing protein n=1 Tax=Thioalkalivibrio sp. ALMg11 TaxID=1158165 RepID=UPI00039BE7F2|nr:EAL domain-containing protein [Thioalkalivibrio sp. ALMg11]
MGCSDCERIDLLPAASGTLYLAPVLAHTRAALRQRMVDEKLPCAEPTSGILALPVRGAGGLGEMLVRLEQVLSSSEQAGCRATFVPKGEDFGLGHLQDTHLLSTLIARHNARDLSAILANDTLDFHFQPIVHAANPTEVFAYEALVRASTPGGDIIPPLDLFKTARNAELLFHLDRSARINAIRRARERGIGSHLFINFNPTAIYDPAFCLETTVREILSGAPEQPGPAGFVFEVIESDQVNDMEHLSRIVERYRQAGFQVALDDLGAGYASLNMLSQLRPDFVKIDRELVSGIDQDVYQQKILEKIIELARDLNTRVVAEGVETVDEWRWLKERVDLCQGYLFARPAAEPPLPNHPES